MRGAEPRPRRGLADRLQLLAAFGALVGLVVVVVAGPFDVGEVEVDEGRRVVDSAPATTESTIPDPAAAVAVDEPTVAGIPAVAAPVAAADPVLTAEGAGSTAGLPVTLAEQPVVEYTPGVPPPPVEAVVPVRTRVAEVAVPAVAVHGEPGGVVTHRFGDTTELGQPQVFLVFEEREGWLHVSLPVRPNGSTGWVRQADVRLSEVPYALAVDLEGRRMTLFEDALPTFSTWVTVGSSATPTPDGLTYVSDLAATTDGFYGPFVFGLSGFSEVLQQFRGGPGQLGIHGTNEPGLMGQAASHGCVRVTNDVMVWLASVVPLGTPVYLL